MDTPWTRERSHSAEDRARERVRDPLVGGRKHVREALNLLSLSTYLEEGDERVTMV